VTFKDGATAIGTATLDGAGAATLNISTLQAGSHAMSAEYSGGVGFPASTGTLAVLGVVLAIGILVFTRQAPRLNLLALGEEQALQLGVEAERVKRVVFVVASLVTGAAISAAGSIGFVGLIVPHAARLLLGPDNRALVPTSVLLGASFLILADLGARTVAGATELPVGVITSFCGAPLFVYLLRRRRGADAW
jgi:iron complex transport system permease protein